MVSNCISRYFSITIQVRFERLDKDKMSGEGAALKKAAKAASASLANLLTYAKVNYDEKVREMTVLRVQDLELRVSEGLTVPLVVCRKVCLTNLKICN